jgi:hypothetical protein
MFPLAFVNTSQDWLILQISLASLRVAHMASHWRITADAAKFNNAATTSHPMVLDHSKWHPIWGDPKHIEGLWIPLFFFSILHERESYFLLLTG